MQDGAHYASVNVAFALPLTIIFIIDSSIDVFF